MNKMNWIEKELSRRYIVGALKHLAETNINPRHHYFIKHDVDAVNIVIARLNELAEFYELEPRNTECASCKLCRRVASPSGVFCDECNSLAAEAENQKAASMYFAMRDENG